MARKLKREDLDKIKSTGYEYKDRLLKRICWAIYMREFEFGEVEESLEEDDVGIEYDCWSYYGEFKSLGLTLKHLKKPTAIYGRYVIEIETDDETFEVTGPFGARCWTMHQTNLKTKKPVVDEDKLKALLDELG